MPYNGAGSLFALGMRLTRLGADGSPLIGPENSYVTDSLVQLEIGLEYEDGNEITQRNGSGDLCLTYKAPDSLKRGTISSLQVCTPDPVILGFLTGGTIILDDDDNPIGYAAPKVGSDPLPNGVSIEFWTRGIIDGSSQGYFWWAVPKAKVRPSDGWTISGEDPLLPELEGTSEQNPNWGDGPDNNWIWESGSVWQYVQVDEIPVDLHPPRYVPVDTELTVTAIEVTPATASITVGDTEQMTVTATMSDATTRDVTGLATWVSATPATVTVDSLGVATGHAAGGPVTVTATYRSQTDTAAITVTV
jgi:hypothetical protein